MIGREDQKSNDLFYTCSLIDYIARKTTNKRKDVVNALGKDRVFKIYDLADIYHCLSMEQAADEFIEASGIVAGEFDNVYECDYNVPTYFDMGRVYKRLILGIAKETGADVVDALFLAYNSFISDKIDDYNSSYYYEYSKNILSDYFHGEVA